MTIKKSAKKGRNTVWRVVVAAFFAVFLGFATTVSAAEQKVVSTEKSATEVTTREGYEKIIVLLQEQDSKNSRELRQVKREIAALGQQLENPGIREIMGGLGYILGLFGVAAYVASRKNNTPKRN